MGRASEKKISLKGFLKKACRKAAMGTGGPVSSTLGNGQTANFVNAVTKLRIPYTWENCCVSWTGFLG